MYVNTRPLPQRPSRAVQDPKISSPHRSLANAEGKRPTLLAVLDELDTDTLSDGGVGLLGLDSDLLEDDTLGVGRSTGGGRAVGGSEGTLLVVVVGLRGEWGEGKRGLARWSSVGSSVVGGGSWQSTPGVPDLPSWSHRRGDQPAHDVDPHSYQHAGYPLPASPRVLPVPNPPARAPTPSPPRPRVDPYPTVLPSVVTELAGGVKSARLAGSCARVPRSAFSLPLSALLARPIGGRGGSSRVVHRWW